MASPWDPQFEALLRQSLPRLAGGEVNPDEDLRSAGLDSMASVELLLQVESAYNVSIPDEALTQQTFATPGNLWRVVESLRTDAA
jgi:diaminopimelate decarboxylase